MKQRVLRFFLFLFLTVLPVACGGSNNDETAVPPPTPAPSATTAPTATTAANLIRVGISADSPPFVDKSGGEIVGFDVDLIRALAAAADFEVELVETNWGTIFETLADGELDVVLSAATITAERAATVDFTMPYFDAGQAIAVSADSSIGSAADLAEQPVGVQQNTSGEIWVQENTTAVSVPYRDVNEAFAALTGGEVTAIVHDQLILLSLINDNPAAGVTLLPDLVTSEQYGIAVRRDRPDLLAAINQSLQSLAADGTYAQLCESWFDTASACLPAAELAAGTLPATATEPPPPTPAATEAAAEATATAPAAGTVTVRILYGSEKRDWLEPLVAAYNEQQRRTEAGELIVIEATPMGSLAAATAVLSGTIEATVWAPASSVYIPTVTTAWQTQYGTELAAAPPQVLVRSPVVIAMWQPMAETLGWPQQPLGWQTIASLSGRNWAEYGHEEWGDFKFGHTHPEYSNSGLVSVLAEAYSGVGKQSGLTTADLAAPALRTFVSQIESSIIDYGDSTGFFADRMLDCEVGGPGYLSAAVLYENLVATQPRTCADQPPLVAIYPGDGTFMTDHPYVVLNAPWITAAQQEAALDFQSYLLAPPQQEQAMSAGFRPANPAAPLTAPLDTANGVDPEQPQVLLETPSADVIAGVQELWRQTKKAADIVVVMDISGSMWAEDVPGTGSKIEAARAGLSQFIGLLGDNDRLEIVTFNNEITVLSELSPVAAKRVELQESVLTIQPDGPTRLYDAILRAHTDLQINGDPARIRAIVVLSDGRDEAVRDDGSTVQASTSNLENVLAAIQVGAEGGNAIKLFTIAYGSEADTPVLIDLAETTGGKLFNASSETIREIYEQIAIFF